MGEPATELTPEDMVVRVVLHLPFLSGYASLQRITAGRQHIPRPLTFDVLAGGHWQDLVLQNYSDELRAELSAGLPHRVYRFAVDPRPESSRPVLKGSSIVWHPRTLDIDFWNVGVGLVTATYGLQPVAGTPWSTVGPDVEESRHVLKDRLEPLRASAIDAVGCAVSTGQLRGAGFLEGGAGKPSAQALWTHISFLLEAKGAASAEQLDAVAEKLTWGGAEGPHPEEMKNVALRIGLDTGVGYFRHDAAAAASAARMVGVHTVVWAAAVDLDRRLLRLRRAERPNSLHGLERQMAQTVAASDQVQAFRTDLDTASIHLSGLDGALWRAYAETWGLTTHLSSVDARLDALEHVLSHATGVITSRRARVLSNLALAFTVAGIISVFGGLIDLSAKQLRTPTSINLLLATGLLALAVALWLLLWGVVVRSAERSPG